MPKKLVIVESPAKAKTISHYLGSSYVVKASVGHVRDLPQKELGVDIAQGYRPTYQIIPGKERVVQELNRAAAKSDVIYLATDADREGEAIAWHVAEAAHLPEEKLRRITFHQITKSAIEEAISNPRGLDDNLVQAQQARRVVDRLVGYQVSPLLSASMGKPLSAGRVQSVALRLVVEREREILAFVPQEYWTLEALLQRRTPERERFTARLYKIARKEPHLSTREDVDRVLAGLQGATYVVTAVRRGKRTQRAGPPFITSTLQAEAGRRLGFSPRRTMQIAQQLYEGVDLPDGRVGLITYMRTDSTHVAAEAQEEARRYIAGRWGMEYLPSKAPAYRAKVALAQEAHEAIRPTSPSRTPEAVQGALSPPQFRLYDLIWRRFIASQMKPAVFDTMTVEISAGEDYLFRASGQHLVFPGHLVLYQDKSDLAAKDRDLPPLKKGEPLDLIELLPEQHFTEPPPRYSEPTLIKELESKGVGRPSTYATIIGVIQDRGYVIKEQGRLMPTDLGVVVCDALLATFADIMDVEYTAGMEKKLDEVAGGRTAYQEMLEDFYRDFGRELEAAEGSMSQALERALWAGLPDDLRTRTCPKCGKKLQVRISHAGRFLGCSGYPECRYTLDLSDPGNPRELEDEYAEGEICDKCGGRMKIIRRGRNEFLGCEHYPQCKNTRPILSERLKAMAREAVCPQCGTSPMEPRKGRYGEYLHCPQCNKNVSLHKLGVAQGAAEEVQVACPECGHSSMERRNGRYGPYYHCPACGKNISEKKMA